MRSDCEPTKDPLVPDVTYTPDFWPEHEELFRVVMDEVPWRSLMYARRTYSMGVPYNYAGASYDHTPWHPAVKAVADKVAASLNFEVTNCLLNCYMSGENHVGWHADDVEILKPGTPIAIVSLGAERALSMRTTYEGQFHYAEQVLQPGSLITMSIPMQATWRHAIRKDKSTSPRVSLTFRHITHVPPMKVDLGKWGSPLRIALREMEEAEEQARAALCESEGAAWSGLNGSA